MYQGDSIVSVSHRVKKALEGQNQTVFNKYEAWHGPQCQGAGDCDCGAWAGNPLRMKGGGGPQSTLNHEYTVPHAIFLIGI